VVATPAQVADAVDEGAEAAVWSLRHDDLPRLGKGGGFSNLEFAVASEAGLVGPGTVGVTTVHEVQLRGAGVVPTTGHDVPPGSRLRRARPHARALPATRTGSS
jgi:hypothetical protein